MSRTIQIYNTDGYKVIVPIDNISHLKEMSGYPTGSVIWLRNAGGGPEYIRTRSTIGEVEQLIQLIEDATQ